MAVTKKANAEAKSVKTFETVSEILNYIQTELVAPKNLHNSFGNYKYRNAEGIFEAVKPYLKETGANLLLSDEVKILGEHLFLEASATLVYDGNAVTVKSQAGIPDTKKGMDKAQIFGACSSYARKYALGGLFLVDDGRDNDSGETEPKAPAKNFGMSQTTPQTTPKTAPAKLDLNIGSRNFQKCKAYLETGGSLEDIKAKYNMTPEVLKSLSS